MNLQENIDRIKQMMGLVESLKDTSWQDDKGNKVTLVDLLKITDDIPVKKISLKKLKPHILDWGGDKKEFDRVKKVNLKYPILVFTDDDGDIITIIDGHHRTQKAIQSKMKTINGKLIPLKSLPLKIRRVFKHLEK